MATLQDLPVELVLDIHLFSLSSALPIVSRHFRNLFSATSPWHRARFLLLRHERKTLAHAIKYTICTLDVVHVLEKIAHSQGKKLKCPQLPRRLFKGIGRGKQEDQVDLPLITHLLETYRSSPNSQDGYPLARAVLGRHLPLIRLLLRHGADPSLKGGWAVTTAIANGDQDLVRMLLEREVDREEAGIADDEVIFKAKNGSAKKRRRGSTGGGGKRRRVEDRCPATKEMLETAVKAKQWAIVDYLTAKGAPPSLNVLAML
ncbi:hypothetical protein NBRC10512_008016 [Rhodotorula toruloides]|uniref:RHTO0S01e05402g1_1 n=2 Tax=Rhodotorula toruloides TaxID=5286 RepID=A0A061ADU6_RHOTO|nr:Ankyrin repeat-containing domain protein [Rhodotorula toruloides NP11]EMS21800.1 Ankyrin repeat-containing domain protein [Rhodotorula toruloides NP11]CDR35710.1 RHTO0S01e05402g1_1 [Rhodotorula toruloides]